MAMFGCCNVLYFVETCRVAPAMLRRYSIVTWFVPYSGVSNKVSSDSSAAVVAQGIEASVPSATVPEADANGLRLKFRRVSEAIFIPIDLR